MATPCARCGSPDSFFSPHTMRGRASYCTKCYEIIDKAEFEKQKQASRIAADMEAERRKQVSRDAKSVILTTTPKVDGFRVAEYLGIESVEFVIGTGAFSEITTSFQDFFGARSSAFETKLRDAKTHAMDALKYLAAEKGANAVLGVDLDYTEFSGNRIALIINGTLVKLVSNR